MTDSPPKPFLRPGKLFALTLAGVLIYLVALVTLVPAGWLWQQARGQVSLPPQVQIRQVTGQLWEGAAGLVVAGFPARLEWSMGAPSFASMAIPVNFTLATAASSLRGEVTAGWQGDGRASASGRVDVSEFEPLIRRSGGAVIEGDVVIEDLDLAWAGGTLTQASGLARWPGGMVTWPMGNRQGTADFPAMLATLTSTADGVALTVSEEGGDGPAAEAEIRWNGMLDLRVYKRMVDLAGQPWSESAGPGDTVLRVRQPLIPGGDLR